MPENNLNTMTDLGDIKSIDFVNRFSKNINDLLSLLGVTRREKLSSDLKIKTFKWDVKMDNTVVSEGEIIPLSKVTRTLDKEYQVEWFKKRRVTTAEAIARHGASKAISESDTRLMREIQNGIKDEFFAFLKKKPTKVKGAGIQKALAESWAKLATFNEFEGSPIVSFVSPLDVATYLGDTKVLADASNVFGFTLLKNFLGLSNVVVMPSVPQGKVYSTAVENLVFANLDVNASDLGSLFSDFTDETGLIAATRSREISNLTYESVFFGANILFAEIPEGVIEATIEAASVGQTG